MKKTDDETWEVKINNAGDLLYKFINEKNFCINDPYADKYIYIDGIGYWSKIYDKQVVKHVSLPIINDVLICKNINDEYFPVGITNTINSIDSKVICWAEISNIKTDFLVSMVWEDPDGCFLTGIDMLIEKYRRKERRIFGGIDLSNIIDSQFIKQGN